MTKWSYTFLPEAFDDLKRLDGSMRKHVLKALDKVAENPLPQTDPHNPGYGVPLGNKLDKDLTGLMKVKLRKDGIRIVYHLVKTETSFEIIVIGMREDEAVYREAFLRKKKAGL